MSVTNSTGYCQKFITWTFACAFLCTAQTSGQSMHESLIEDAAGMFNERGFLSSNSFSLDGNEIINDFNGNLIYSRQLISEPISQDGLQFDLKLTYNGSVGHQINTGYGIGMSKKNSFNAPEWILSVNNIAIQTLNFENEMICFETGTTRESTDDDVSMLVNGYHTCYDETDTPHRGVVSILMGDGSLLQLYSVCNTTEPGCVRYTPMWMVAGEYRTYSKDDRTRGYLDDSDGSFTLFFENGNEVTFQSYSPTWYTCIDDYNGTQTGEVPRQLYPVEFRDRLGNSFYVTTENDLVFPPTIYGRPRTLLAHEYEISIGAGFMYIKKGAETLYSMNYASDLAQYPSSTSNSTRGYITSISDFRGHKDVFEYSPYRRSGDNMGSDYVGAGTPGGGCSNFLSTFSGEHFSVGLSRLHKVKYAYGGEVEYSYWEDPRSAWNVSTWDTTDILVDYGTICNSSPALYPCKKSSHFTGLGRDPFFTNIVVAKRRYVWEQSVPKIITWDTLDFASTVFGSVEISDEFTTMRATDSIEHTSFLPTDPLPIHTFMYKFLPEPGTFSSSVRDRGWTQKLISRKVNGFEHEYLDVLNHWDIDTLSDCSAGCDGTFLLTKTITKKDGVSSFEEYSTSFVGDSTDLKNNNISLRRTVNSWNLMTEQFYNEFYLEPPTVLGAISTWNEYYDNTLIDSIRTFDIDGGDTTLLSRSATLYYDTTDSPLGKVGSVSRTSSYLIENGTEVDSVVDSFTYNPSANGGGSTIRLHINTLGDSINYYCSGGTPIPPGWSGYDPENPIVVASPVLYTQANDDGTQSTIDDEQWTLNGPFWYRKVSYLGEDSLQWFQEVDSLGKILGVVDANGFYSEVQYKDLARVSKVIRAGGFKSAGYFTPTEQSATLDPDEDGEYTGSTLSQCGSTSLRLKDFGGIKYESAFLFNNATFFDGQEVTVDSAFLVVHCSEIGSEIIGVFAQSLNIGTSYPGCSGETASEHPNSYTGPLALGESKIDVTSIVQLWADDPPAARGIILEPDYVGSGQYDQEAKIYASEYTDPSKRPQLFVYYHGAPLPDSTYSLLYSYDDKILDGDEMDVTVQSRSSVSGFSQKSRTGFDELGRAVRTDVFKSDATFSSTYSSYDHLDRVDTTTDQLGNKISQNYDYYSRNTRIDYPFNANTQAEYSTESAATLGLDTLFDMRQTDLFKVKYTDENSNLVYEYSDNLDRLRLKRVELDATTNLDTYFDYDLYGNLITVIKPNGDSVGYEYNNLGWLLKEWSADYDTVFYEYDKLGRVIKKRDGRLTDLGSASGVYIDPNVFVQTSLPGDSLFDTAIVLNSGRVDYVLNLTGTNPTYNSTARIEHNGLLVEEIVGASGNSDTSFTAVVGDTVVIIAYFDPGDDFPAPSASASASQVKSFASESHHQFTDYDAMSRVTATGFLHVSDTCNWDSCWVNAILSKDTTKLFLYDLENSDNSKGRLSLSFVKTPPHNYGVKLDYDFRGRVTIKTAYFNAALTVPPVITESGNAVVSLNATGTSNDEFTVAISGPSTTVSYALGADAMDCSTDYVRILLNGIKQDSICMGTGFPQQESGSFSCVNGDIVRIEASATSSGSIAMTGSAAYSETIPATSPPYLTGNEYITEYTYNLADQVTSVTYPADTSGYRLLVTYDYDDLGRLKSVGDGTDPIRYAQLSYTARNEIESMVLGNNIQTMDYVYNSRGWLKSINGGTSVASGGDLFGQNLYYYSHPDFTSSAALKNGNILGQKISVGGTIAQDDYHYTYDAADRLAKVDYDVSGSTVNIEEYSYDSNGNRETSTVASVSETYNYTSGTNLLENVTGSGTRYYQYDKSGNITADIAKGCYFNYDVFNQLDTVSMPNQLYLAFGYDPGGQRVFKYYRWSYQDTCDNQVYLEPSLTDEFKLVFASYEYGEGSESYFHLTGGGPGGPGGPQMCTYYDSTIMIYLRGAGGEVLAEYNDCAGTDQQAQYIYAGSQRIAMVEPDGDVLYYLNDHLGSARAVVNESGALVDEYKKYYAFGESADEVISSENAYKYTGKPFDTDGGFDCYYYGARYYEPTLGRFLAVDPLASKYPGVSPYVYTLNNPINLIDPDGRQAVAPPPPAAAPHPQQDLFRTLGNPSTYIYVRPAIKVGEFLLATWNFITAPPLGNFGDLPIITDKIETQMYGRNWGPSSIYATVANPHTTRKTNNRVTGNPATVYYNKDGSYVVVDDVTGEVVQVSDRNDPDWIPDRDIEDPYRPEQERSDDDDDDDDEKEATEG